ncbi:hypothetical protein SORBI_3008G164375 [Sorghum bicolor]|nr:hypothetical protein SORBI_3008G164375 [Sorghum bicolor]
MAHGPQRRGSITCVRTAGPGGDSQPRHASISRSSPSPPVQQGKNHRLVVWLRGEIVDSSRASAIPAAGDPFLPLLERGVVRVRAVGRERIRLNGPASLTRWVPPLPPPPQLLLLLVAPLSPCLCRCTDPSRTEDVSSAAPRPPPLPLELAPPFKSGGCRAEDVAARGTRKPSKCGVCGVVVASSADVESHQ